MPVGSRYQAAPTTPALGLDFYDVVEAATFPTHTLRFRNDAWAARVGLAALTDDEWRDHFARFQPLPDNLQEPLALRYHGHQFRQYNPHLGDGRGFLYAQLRDPVTDRLLDLGTKGSGQTPYSRGGDGRLTLKGGVREVLATEMLEAQGVDTSKSFSLFETGESLLRYDEPSPTRSSVLVRLSHSHVRFGTFQRFAVLEEHDNLRILLDFVIEHYYPDLADHPEGNTPAALLAAVARRSATLCASWVAAGFAHGVLNTDNMNITGESFDYGPYRFVPHYDPDFVAAYFDHTGLYAFGQQAASVYWNLQQLAIALRPLSDTEPLVTALLPFQDLYNDELTRLFLQRLGLQPHSPDKDETLASFCFEFLGQTRMGYDQFFFDWYGGTISEDRAKASPEAAHYNSRYFAPVRTLLGQYEPLHPERLRHPLFQKPRPCSLLIDEIEEIWDAIAERDDWSLFETKIQQIRAWGSVMS